LACGIAAKRQGLSYVILEKGSIVDAIRRFPTFMTFFSTADVLEIGDMPFLSAGFRPTRVKAVRYYAAAAHRHSLNIITNICAERIGKDGGEFAVRLMTRCLEPHT
jgi:thioredoxin reductase (NADPH)